MEVTKGGPHEARLMQLFVCAVALLACARGCSDCVVTDGFEESGEQQGSDDSLHVSAWCGEERPGVRLFPASGEGTWAERSCHVCWH